MAIDDKKIELKNIKVLSGSERSKRCFAKLKKSLSGG